MMLDETKYVLQALPPANPDTEFHERSWYQAKSDICGEIQMGLQFPYTTLAFVDGQLPEGGFGSFSGSRQRTLPGDMSMDRLPVTETVTWSLTIDAPSSP
jgi:hypothetical protein